MIIDTNLINASGSARSRGPAPAAASSNSAQTTPAPGAEQNTKDSVVLSSEAQNLVRLQAKISDLPEVNLDRVASIKQAIAERRFEINPERIAENMLNQDELLG